jgi:WD40 repeat protein
MELIEGETLAARLAKGALPLADVLKLGAQIADALDRAHRAGVMHRDLKPGSVMLTRSGAKLMDFGLARASALGATSELTSSPTVASPITAEGTILGTFPYMAPEQLEGKEADARADLWALGCVLCEMATGKRAFDGTSQASLITAIMGSEPPPISQLSPLAPPALDRLVDGCLAKDAAERIQSAHDVKLQLQWIAAGGSQTGAPASVPARRRMALLAPTLAAAVLAVAAFFVGRALPSPAQRSASHAVPVHFKRLTFSRGLEVQPSLSSDGRSFVYVSSADGEQRDIYLQRVGGENATNLTPDSKEDDWSPAFSPDGQWIAFRSEREGKGIFVMGATGESVRRVSELGFNPVWSPDGKYLYFASNRGGSMNLWRRPIDEETGKPLGEPEPVTSGGQWNGQLSISKTGLIPYADLISSSSVERLPLDPATGRVVGEPSLILGSSREIGVAVPSPDGRWVLMTSNDTQEDLLVAAADGTGMRRITSDRFKDRSPEWGPDSELIYFFSDRTGRYEDWRIHRDGSGLEQVTSTEGGSRCDPCPSPDGRIVAVYGFGKIEESCGLVDLTAPLPEHSLTYLPLFDKTHGFLASCWSPEGKRLAGGLRTASTLEPGVVIYSLETKSFERVSESGSPIAWFPDGRRVLVEDKNSLMTVDVETRKTQPVLDKLGHGVQTAALARDGRSVLVVRTDFQADIWMFGAQEPTTDTPGGRWSSGARCATSSWNRSSRSAPHPAYPCRSRWDHGQHCSGTGAENEQVNLRTECGFNLRSRRVSPIISARIAEVWHVPVEKPGMALTDLERGELVRAARGGFAPAGSPAGKDGIARFPPA